jgi:hypothetical protein
MYVPCRIRRLEVSTWAQKYSASVVDDEADEWLGNTPDDTDTIVLHRFFEKHADKIGKELLSLSKPCSESDQTAISGKGAWDGLCAALVDLGQAPEVPRLSPYATAEHREYQDLMSRYAHRNTDAVRDLFVETPAPKVCIGLPLVVPRCAQGFHRINRPCSFSELRKSMSRPSTLNSSYSTFSRSVSSVADSLCMP